MASNPKTLGVQCLNALLAELETRREGKDLSDEDLQLLLQVYDHMVLAALDIIDRGGVTLCGLPSAAAITPLYLVQSLRPTHLQRSHRYLVTTSDPPHCTCPAFQASLDASCPLDSPLGPSKQHHERKAAQNWSGQFLMCKHLLACCLAIRLDRVVTTRDQESFTEDLLAAIAATPLES